MRDGNEEEEEAGGQRGMTSRVIYAGDTRFTARQKEAAGDDGYDYCDYCYDPADEASDMTTTGRRGAGGGVGRG